MTLRRDALRVDPTVGRQQLQRTLWHLALPRRGHERITAVVAPAKPIVAEVGDVAEVALDEVIGGEPGDCGVVGLHVGHAVK